ILRGGPGNCDVVRRGSLERAERERAAEYRRRQRGRERHTRGQAATRSTSTNGVQHTLLEHRGNRCKRRLQQTDDIGLRAAIDTTVEMLLRTSSLVRKHLPADQRREQIPDRLAVVTIHRNSSLSRFTPR